MVTHPAMSSRKGHFRPEEGVQRGGVNDTFYSGDPLTPGYAATKDAKRLPIKDNPEITKIPVMPISYGDAQPLLAAIGGPTVPREWRGNLPLTYHVGPGPAKVHLKVTSNWDIKPIYDVIGRIPGSEFPDQWVIRGNHHDAWVNGAEDPISGQVALMEEARSMGELLKQGWKPKRTIIFCAWDGEEPGLLGSTEWVEMHQDELRKKAVMYVNSDTNGRGFLGIDGSHNLEHFINGVERDIPDPETKLTVWKRAQLYSDRASGRRRTIAKRRETGKTCASALWVTAPIMCPSSTSSASPRSIWASSASRRAASTTRFMTISTGTRTLRIPTSSMAARCRRRRERR